MERVPLRLGRIRTNVETSAPSKPSVRIYDLDGDSETSTGELLEPVSKVRVCRICTVNSSRYTCPRCNAPYCSVDCYKEHGMSCTEAFYESHVRSEMTLQQKDTQDSSKDMTEVLNRVKEFQQQQLDQSNESTLDDTVLEERLQQLALMDEHELSLDVLTPEERKQFLAEVADGRLSTLVTLWQPWWLMSPNEYEKETRVQRDGLICETIGNQVYEEEEESVKIESKPFPSALFSKNDQKAMPSSLDQIVKTAVSPCVRFHLVDIIASYTLLMRLFNGDWTQDVEDAGARLLELSSVLGEDARFETLEELVGCFLEKTFKDGGTTSTSEMKIGTKKALEDATSVLSSRLFALDATADLQSLLKQYESLLSTASAASKQEKREMKAATKRVRNTRRKVGFYQMWTFHASEGNLQSLQLELSQLVSQSTT